MPTCPTCRTHYDEGAVRCTKDGETLLPDEAFGAADAPLRPGDMVGEYRIEGKLGEGGFGTVYKGLHPLIGKRCAIKTLHRQFSSNPQIVSRFIAEARAVNQIRHRNIIDIFSFGCPPNARCPSSVQSHARWTPPTPQASHTAISSPRTSTSRSTTTACPSPSCSTSGSPSS